MNAPTDEFVRIAEQSRKAVTAAVHAWGETLQNAAGSLAFPAPLPGRDQTLAVVDSWFDVAAQVLAEQRAATTALVTRTHEAAEASIQSTLRDLAELSAVDRITSMLRVVGSAS